MHESVLLQLYVFHFQSHASETCVSSYAACLIQGDSFRSASYRSNPDRFRAATEQALPYRYFRLSLCFKFSSLQSRSMLQALLSVVRSARVSFT